MKTIVVILICVTVLLIAYLYTRPRTIYEVGVFEPSWPVTWTYDWSGGHGRDRHRILRERGPYHMNYGPPHSTPGGDGRARR